MGQPLALTSYVYIIWSPLSDSLRAFPSTSVWHCTFEPEWMAFGSGCVIADDSHWRDIEVLREIYVQKMEICIFKYWAVSEEAKRIEIFKQVTANCLPMKTYLPDGDIDLSLFSKHQNLNDTWAKEICSVLESEEKSEYAEFHVKEVHYIQAEVKIIKCLVENIVVDISFNQLGGLCTLCFLEKVDHLIGQNHLFKEECYPS